MTIALITGGSRGLGKSMALHLARRGTDIILTYHSNKEEADKVAGEIISLGRKAVSLQLDVSKSGTFSDFTGQVKQTLQQTWQRRDFDYLVNNAGTGVNKPIADTSESDFDSMVAIHLKGPYFLTQALLPFMKDGGRIVNISSGLARFSRPGMSAYAMMKGGVEVMTRYRAAELGARRIAVNTIAPGAIETDFGGGHVRDDQEMNQQIASATALGRAGLPDDIGGAVAMILSDEAGWINGQRIEVSGGILL